ncbi:molecular chaperone HtpG [Bacteroidota bacterium]
MSDNKNISKYEFKAEVKQLLDILVHSLYTNREIFLRELISNSSDALDRLRFESIKGSSIEQGELSLEINVDFDDQENILTVKDTGIGMTQDELIANIGTIAKSGSSEFIKKLSSDSEDANNIIGKFGVGFYSVFMVAEKVEIVTKSYQEKELAHKWISDGLGSYEISEVSNDVDRGTQVKIFLKNDAKEYADKSRLEQIIQKHSNFIAFPIKVKDNQVNNISAIWREPKSSIKKEQYNDFYKYLSHESSEPLEVIHKLVDAPIQFNCLLFIPETSDEFFIYNKEFYGLDLYVKRVLIQHRSKDLLPEYLGFVKGVVDSEDLPLNISRETLQENIIFMKISNSVTTEVLRSLSKLAEDDKEKYLRFWKGHNKLFKMGYTDFNNKDKFTQLLRFNSSYYKSDSDYLSLNDYVQRTKENQKVIYYMFGSSREAISNDPHIEIFKQKGIEVLYLYEPVDEIIMNSLNKFEDYEIKSIDQADLAQIEELNDVEVKDSKIDTLSRDDELHLKSFLSKIKEILGDKVTDVKESKRLNESPVCLVNPDNTISSSMQKILSIVGKDSTVPKKIFEINKDHKLIRNLLTIFKTNSNDSFLKNIVLHLYDSALMLEGYLNDPHLLVSRLNNLIEESSGLYSDKVSK